MFFLKEKKTWNFKQKRSNALFENSFTPTKSISKTVSSTLSKILKILEPRELYEHSHVSFVEDETADESLEKSIR